MRRLIYTNGRGESVALAHAPYFLTKLDGTGAVEAEIQMQVAPYQDGATFLDAKLSPRYLSIEGALHWPGATPAAINERRQWLVRVLNPKLGLGLLRYEYEGGVKEIRAIAESSPVFPDREGAPVQRFMIHLVCPDPAWLDPEFRTWKLASIVGGFSFPIRLPLSFGRVGQSARIENPGDLDAPVLIVFRGPLKTPVLENKTTSKRIKLDQVVPEGDYLEINTAFGQKSVTRVSGGSRTNAFHWVAPDSEFWSLVPGDNEISYSATEESEAGAVTLEFRPQYLGV
ncbi:phage tail family protein [Paenibacillus sp. KR2-11]|uniref:phage tail family protein n=1 Tax=Paenibacillus sp. KR2-11 TaxID=3385500 RepID=UPI0038FD110B